MLYLTIYFHAVMALGIAQRKKRLGTCLLLHLSLWLDTGVLGVRVDKTLLVPIAIGVLF